VRADANRSLEKKPAPARRRLASAGQIRYEASLQLDRTRGGTVNQLVSYLLENLILDFQGDLTLEMVRDFLREDESREAKALLSKLVEDRGVSEMLICIADCLRDALGSGIRQDEVKEQIRLYAES
jgi:hypothetical protein